MKIRTRVERVGEIWHLDSVIALKNTNGHLPSQNATTAFFAAHTPPLLVLLGS